MSDLVRIRRALISVSDKTGLADFAKILSAQFGVELISTGGTAKFLRDHGLPVRDVSEVTGFPEMMDGRVKTLHPKIHGGLLALRDNPEHVAAAQTHDIEFIDLVCINLYPFAQTIASPDVSFDHAIENIDIGGPSMVRSGAKNHRSVTVVTSPVQYEKVLGDLREHAGCTCGRHRLKLAQAAFDHTATYDRTIANYLTTQIPAKTITESVASPSTDLPASLTINLQKKQPLRYGENPHQLAALYIGKTRPAEASVAFAEQLHGKELSYINLLDADAALSAVKELSAPTVCIVKHATPCGYGTAADLPTAFARAYSGDPLAAFGGIVALNQTVDLPTAQAITGIDKLLEVIVAPAYEPAAIDLVRSRWKNVRLLAVGPIQPGAIDPSEFAMHKIVGGWLVQQRDRTGTDRANWKVVSKRQPTSAELEDLALAWLACKHVKSNAITIAHAGTIVGVGGGQVDRVNAARIAVQKAGERARGSVAASDAFFPFPDGPELLLNAGITAIIHPGGAMRDHETQSLCDSRSAALILTGERHFKH